jgi:predicted ATPase
LHRLLASRALANAPALTRFLEHIVTETIEGRAERLKEYAIGVEVFQRGTSFDPNADTIVRVSARRLRAKLVDYYQTEGWADPIVVDLPKGRYVPEFRTRPPIRQVASDDRFESPDRRHMVEASDLPGSQPTFHLPAVRNSLIGREHDLKAVQQLLRHADVRLVTLTGVGGSGKTRLALEAAWTLLGDFPGGLSFVSLAGVSDASAVGPTLAQVFGLRHTDGRPLVEALQAHVRRSCREPTLIVLDNFEHLLASASLVSVLLDANGLLKLLVTSRAVLRVYGEHDYAVPPLALPDRAQPLTVAALGTNPAVALFSARAVAADHRFALTLENAEAVAELCCRLDGLPLAIELAAARVKTLPPDAILARLQSRLNLLCSDLRDVPERQHTLRRTFDWSHELLTPGEQQLFRRLAVFAGGFTLEGVEAVCNARLDLQIEPLLGVSSLLDKSLLQQVSDGVASRYRTIETVREYGLELLSASGEQEAVSRAHAANCLVLAEEGNALTTPADRDAWFASCQTEHENFRAALDHLIAENHTEWAQRLGIALHAFWDRLDHVAEGRARLEAILALGGAEPRRSALWAKAACCAAGLAIAQGDFDSVLRLHQAALDVYHALGDRRGVVTELSGIGFAERERGNHSAARHAFEQSVGECRKLGDRWSIAAAQSNLASALSALGEHTRAREMLEEAAAIFRELGDSSGVAWTCNHLGDVARNHCDSIQAARRYQDALDLFRQTGDRWGMARSYEDLGYLACEQRDHAAARAWFTEALRTYQALEHRRGAVHVIEGFVVLAAFEGDHARALVLGGAAAVLRNTAKAAGRQHEEQLLDQAVSLSRKGLADHALAQSLWSAGSRLQLDQAIRIALKEAPLPLSGAIGN